MTFHSIFYCFFNLSFNSHRAVLLLSYLNFSIASAYSTHLYSLCSLDNVISFKEGFFDNEEVILHELAHSYHNWKEDKLFFSKNRNEAIGYSLDEAIKLEMVNTGFKNEVHLVKMWKPEGRRDKYIKVC